MKTTLTIEGMHCQSCATLLTDVLSETPGVKSAKVDYPTKKATVEHTTKEEILQKAIEAEGYKVIR